jgi:TPR repeat protein
LVYLEGKLGQAQNPPEAFHWCKLAAEQGDFVAQMRLGDLFAVGEGVAQDKAQALIWYRKAAAAPPLVANRMFTQRTVKSLQDLRETEVNQAISRLEGGLAPALPPLVDSRKLRARAEHGDPQAQNELADLYTRGRSGVPEDNSQAAGWYRKAADQQFGVASYNLSNLYLGVPGVPRDDVQFLAWLQKAAEQGYVGAQVALAHVLLTGFRAPKDPDRALLWFRKAADQGDGLAQFSLGATYEQGEIVPKDLAQAAAWYQKAAAQKGIAQDDARQALKRLQGTANP